MIREFISYVGVGGAAFAVDFGSLFALTSLGGIHYLVSATIAFLLGLITNYLLCILWVFDYRRVANRLHEFMVFGAIGVAGLILNNLTLYCLTDFVGVHYLISKVVAAGFILLFNFSLRRWMLFSPGIQTAASSSPDHNTST